MRRLPAALVRDQSGVVTREQLRAYGCGDAEVRAMLRSGRWTALRRGVYVEHRPVRARGRAVAAGGGLAGAGRASRRQPPQRGRVVRAGAARAAGTRAADRRPRSPAAAGDVRPAHRDRRAARTPRHPERRPPGHHAGSYGRGPCPLAALPGGRRRGGERSAAARTDRTELDRVLRDCWTWPGVRRAARVVDIAGDGSDFAPGDPVPADVRPARPAAAGAAGPPASTPGTAGSPGSTSSGPLIARSWRPTAA